MAFSLKGRFAALRAGVSDFIDVSAFPKIEARDVVQRVLAKAAGGRLQRRVKLAGQPVVYFARGAFGYRPPVYVGSASGRDMIQQRKWQSRAAKRSPRRKPGGPCSI